MLNMRDVAATVKALVDTEAYQAVKFVSATFVVRVTKPRAARGKAWDKRNRSVSLVLSYGAPNYRERRLLKRKGLPKSIQVRDFPQPR